ncbi:YebC/PmpR family DNA-binding transcriptional regulator [Patescibacteria group bacterium]
MSGHSKWSTIKRKKGVEDAKRSKIFSKMSRLITVAAKEGGPNPDSNSKLRLAIEKAKYSRMPKDNIDRAIQKGSGGSGGGNFSEISYEGFGPNGEAFYIKALTDNANRTVSEIRGIFGKHGGSLGSAGSTSYIFSDPENLSFKVASSEVAINLYDDLEDNDDVQDVYVNFDIEQ